MVCKPLILEAFTVILLAGSAANAHDQRLHGDRAAEGEVVSVSPDSVVLKTAKGSVSLKLLDSTTVERGDEKLTRDALHSGEEVTAVETILASGEVVARAIIIHAAHQPEGDAPVREHE